MLLLGDREGEEIAPEEEGEIVVIGVGLKLGLGGRLLL